MIGGLLAVDALPPDNAGYVAAAYLVVFALVLIYAGIMAVKLSRLERDLVELNELVDRQQAPATAPAAAAPAPPVVERAPA